MEYETTRKNKKSALYKYMIALFGSWLYLCTACVSTPSTATREPIENNLMELIILYENIMPRVFNNEFYYNEHNQPYLNVQFNKLEQINDRLSRHLPEKRPDYVESEFSRQDPAIQMGLRPVVENVNLALSTYQTGNLTSTRRALKSSVDAIVKLSASPALAAARMKLPVAMEPQAPTKSDKEVANYLESMRLAKYHLLSKELPGDGSTTPKQPLVKTETTTLAQSKVKGSALHAKLKLASGVQERAQALHELGRFYSNNEKYDSRGLASAYLETCIKVSPGTAIAEKCYIDLQKTIFNNYGDFSANLSLSREDRIKLENMRILSTPRVLSVGMVGGLDNFY